MKKTTAGGLQIASIETVRGTRVRLFGLTKATLNDAEGTVKAAKHKARRLVIELAGGRRIAVKPSNLRVLRMPVPPRNPLRRLESTAEMARLQRDVNMQRAKIARAVVAGTFITEFRHSGGTSFVKLVPADVLQLPLREATVRLTWWDPDCTERPPARPIELQGHLGEHSTGTLEFVYHDPCSLAIELSVFLSSRTLDDFKMFDAGLLRLMGEPELFGSALLHFVATDTCCPAPLAKSPVRRWGKTVQVQTMERFIRKTQDVQIGSPAKKRFGSRSMACTILAGIIPKDADLSKLPASVHVQVPWLNDVFREGYIPTLELPGWWRAATAPWDSAFKTLFEGKGALSSIPCYFWGSAAAPDGLGCCARPGFDYSASDVEPCPFAHDEQWLAQARALRTRNHSACAGCQAYAGHCPCATCSYKWLCGSCTATIGRVQCLACEQARRPIPEATRSQVDNPIGLATFTGGTRYTTTKNSEEAAQNAREALSAFTGDSRYTSSVQNVSNALSQLKPAAAPPTPECDSPMMVDITAPPCCAACGATEGKLDMCSGCQNVRYCSKKCQKADWVVHKPVCKAFRAQRKKIKKREKAATASASSTANAAAPKFHSDASGTGHGICLLLHGTSEESRLMFYADHNGQMMGRKCSEESFRGVDDLCWLSQVLISCSFLPDLPRLKKLLANPPTGTSLTSLRAPGVGFTPLDWAARKGHFEIAEFLATDPRTKGMVRRGAPVGWACYTNRVKLAKMLVRCGADPTQTDNVLFNFKPTPFIAVENGSYLALKWLVEECGVDIASVRDRHGRGILRVIQENMPAGHQPTPSNLQCAKYARMRGATQ